jgi:hypothetical protein
MLSHSMELEALCPNPWGVCRVVAETRPRDDLWRHLADSLFGLDREGAGHSEEAVVEAPGTASVYGITGVVDGEDRAAALHRRLGRGLAFGDDELRRAGAPVGAATRRLELLEQSATASSRGPTYHHSPVRARARARASSVRWLGTAMGVRVRTLEEHHAAADAAAAGRASRRAERRERWAARVAADSPLFGFSRDLLRWIVSQPPSAPAAAAAAAAAAEYLGDQAPASVSEPPHWDRIKVRVVG